MSAPQVRTLGRTHIRWMIRRDMWAVVTIEAASYSLPWEEADFLRCLRQRNCIGMVAEQDNRVVGYMVYELHKPKLHLLNFAVDPAERLQGIGTSMVGKLKNTLASHRRNYMTLAIDERNDGGLMFFKGQGFQAVKVLHDYYDDRDSDAILMRFDLPKEN